MFLDSRKRNKPELELDYESRSILKCEGEKAPTRYFESKSKYVKPEEITIVYQITFHIYHFIKL